MDWLDETTDVIYKSVVSFLAKDIHDPGVRTGFIMNSGLQGTCGVKKVNGTFQPVHCPADGSLETRGAEYACSNWNDVQCYDYKKNDEDYDHGGIGNQPFTNDLVLRFINNEKFPSDDKSWFSGKNMYIVIGCAVVVVVIIAIVVTVICIKKKKQNNQTINESLFTNNEQ